MKARTLFMVGALGLMLLYLFITPGKEPDTIEVKPDLANISSISCIVQRYLLEPDTTRQISPLFSNLGDHHFQITTNSEMAQKFFDQGLILLYGFNHAEAHRSFLEAARLDPGCAMAYWGQAYALGPNINDPEPDEARRRMSREATDKALELAPGASQTETDLIKALDSRYSGDPEKPLNDLNVSYMQAMETLLEKHPSNSDILTLYAASVMNTSPWNYWDENMEPHQGFGKCREALENAIALDPDNPGPHHYYIHLMELPQPDAAISSAEKLTGLIPAAGHLQHMPSHIFIRTGRYLDAVEVNINAIAADEDYISQCYAQGMYPLAYYPHNIHFLWSASSYIGMSKTALDAARKTAEKVPLSELENLPFLQDFKSVPMQAYVRFGKWNEILTIPDPGEPYKHLRLMWHYSRGMAFIRKGNLAEAEEELKALRASLDDPDLGSIMAVPNNRSSDIAKVAYHVVHGEYLAATGRNEEAIEAFNKGVAAEDALVYTEPAGWHIPVRQNLGTQLLRNGDVQQAEKVFRKDLEKSRENGWSLMGLYRSLKAQNKVDEAEAVKLRFDKAWKNADIKIDEAVL